MMLCEDGGRKMMRDGVERKKDHQGGMKKVIREGVADEEKVRE